MRNILIKIFIIFIFFCLRSIHPSFAEEQLQPLSPSLIELDLGAAFNFYPHANFFDHYQDADKTPLAAAAISLSYNRFRLQYGYLQATYDQNNYHGEFRITAQEVLFLLLKNTDKRTAFIGGGPVTVNFQEEILTDQKSATAYGYKLVVGGKDLGSYLKTTFSYTTVNIPSLTNQHFRYGGYMLSFYFSFSAF